MGLFQGPVGPRLSWSLAQLVQGPAGPSLSWSLAQLVQGPVGSSPGFSRFQRVRVLGWSNAQRVHSPVIHDPADPGIAGPGSSRYRHQLIQGPVGTGPAASSSRAQLVYSRNTVSTATQKRHIQKILTAHLIHQTASKNAWALGSEDSGVLSFCGWLWSA
jgi:hypothetical protein